MIMFYLHRWARHRTVRAEHATVAGLRFKFFTAPFADIEMLASVSRHLLNCLMPALGTGDYRSRDHGSRCLVSQHHPKTDISAQRLILWVMSNDLERVAGLRSHLFKCQACNYEKMRRTLAPLTSCPDVAHNKQNGMLARA